MITWTTVVPTKSDSDTISCLQMLRTLHLNQRGSIDQWCIIPILRIGLIHKCFINDKSPINMQTKHDITVTPGWQDSCLYFYLQRFSSISETSARFT